MNKLYDELDQYADTTAQTSTPGVLCLGNAFLQHRSGAMEVGFSSCIPGDTLCLKRQTYTMHCLCIANSAVYIFKLWIGFPVKTSTKSMETIHDAHTVQSRKGWDVSL